MCGDKRISLYQTLIFFKKKTKVHKEEITRVLTATELPGLEKRVQTRLSNTGQTLRHESPAVSALIAR